MSFTKQDFIKNLTTKVPEITIPTAAKCLDSIVNTLIEQLQTNKEVKLPDFGTFNKKMLPERTGRNPQTGEGVLVKAKNVVRFKPTSHLKQVIN